MKCPYEKVRLDVLPLFLQSNLMAFRFLFFRTDVAGFQILSQIFVFFPFNFVLSTASFGWFDKMSSCYASSAFVNNAFSSKKACKIWVIYQSATFYSAIFLQKAFILFALLNEFVIIQQSSRSHFQFFILMQNNFVESSNESNLVKSETKDKSLWQMYA